MNPGLRTLGDASLTIGVCRAIPVEMRAQTRELSGLETEPSSRNEGQATALMHQVCEEADKANITLVIFVQPFNDPEMGRAQLADWYARRFGFVPIQPDPLLMARMPHSTPRILSSVGKAVQSLARALQ